MLTVLLALGSGAAYGVSNFLGPHLSKASGVVAVLVISQLAALVACVALVVGSGDAFPATHDVLLGVLAGLANALGLILFYEAAARGPVSIVAPIGALGAIIPVAYGIATGEALTAVQGFGIVVAIAGGMMASRRAPGAGEHHSDPRMSVILAALGALAFGTFLTSLPEATAHGRNWGLLDARVALLALMLAWAGRRLAEIRWERRDWTLTLPGVLLISGTLMYAAAADRGLLSLVSVLNSLSPVFTIALGVAIAGERLTRTQSVGVCCAVAGVVLIAA